MPPVAWPPRSSDLTSFDYLGTFESLVYAVKLSTRAELFSHIMNPSEHIRNDKPSVMRSVIFTFTKGHNVHR